MAIFDPPPILEGEDPLAYNELLLRVSTHVKPADLLEEIWVRNVVDLIWEISRLRRLKTELLNATAHEGLKLVLEPLVGFDAQGLVNDWALRKTKAVVRVNMLLKRAKLSMDSVIAQTLRLNIDTVERIERMTATAEARINIILREIERHRSVLADALRGEAKHLDDSRIPLFERRDGRNAA